MLRATEHCQVKVYHSIILNPMRVKAVLIVLGQLSNVHLLEVCWSHNRQFVILMTYWLLAVIQNESKQSTNKFDFFIVEKVGLFQKILANSRQYCKIDGIMVLHSSKFDGHKIVLRDLTCSKCSIEAFCDDWKTLKQIDKKRHYARKNEYIPWSDGYWKHRI